MYGRLRALVPVVALSALLAAGMPSVSGSQEADLGATADEATSVVEVHVADRAELERLIATGVDLDPQIHETDHGIGVHAVISESEAATLEDLGFDVGAVVYDAETAAQRVAEREATIQAHIAENGPARGSLPSGDLWVIGPSVVSPYDARVMPTAGESTVPLLQGLISGPKAAGLG